MTLELHSPDFISSYSTLTLTFQLAGPQPSWGFCARFPIHQPPKLFLDDWVFWEGPSLSCIQNFAFPDGFQETPLPQVPEIRQPRSCVGLSVMAGSKPRGTRAKHARPGFWWAASPRALGCPALLTFPGAPSLWSFSPITLFLWLFSPLSFFFF